MHLDNGSEPGSKQGSPSPATSNRMTFPGQMPETGMVEERVKRRLAAILAADVVGYSRLMGEDEVGALAALKEHNA